VGGMGVAVGGTGVGVGGLGVAVGGTGVLVGGIGVVAVAVGGTGVRVACTGSDVGVACAGAGVRVQAVAARMIPNATSKGHSLFLFIVKPPFRVAGKLGKAAPLAHTTECVMLLTINLDHVQKLKLAKASISALVHGGG